MRLPTDKILHFLASALIVCLLARWLPMGYAVLATIAVGVAKETIWDGILHKGTPEFMDLFADVTGAFLGVLIAG